MATISGVARPAYVYDAANNQWVPIGVGPHTHSLADLPSVVSTNGGSTIVNQAPTLKGLVIQGASGQTANLVEIQNSSSSIVSYIRVDGSALFSRITTTGVHTGNNTAVLGVTANANSSSQGTGVIMWGTSSGGFGGGIHYIGDNRGADGHHTFWTYNGSSWNSHTRISKDGNIGLGDITSSAKLRITQYSDNSLISLSQYKNDGGTSNMISFNDDRAYAAATSGDSIYGYSWNTGFNTGSLLRLEYFNGSFVPAFNVKASGNVGVGTNNPGGRLQVRVPSNERFPVLGTAHGSLRITGSTDAWGMYLGLKDDTGAGWIQAMRGDSATPYDLYLQPVGGNVLIGYTGSNGAYKLQVNSQIFATSSSIATSDVKYKKDITELTGGLDMIKALRPVEFNWKPQEDVIVNEKIVREAHSFPEGKTVGFIAQEVQEALADKSWVTNIVKENSREAVLAEDGTEIAPKEDFLGIAETNLIAVLVSAVKELTAKVEALEAKLA